MFGKKAYMDQREWGLIIVGFLLGLLASCFGITRYIPICRVTSYIPFL